MILAAMLAQFADATTYALGMATITPVELSPLAALGPGPVLLAKAAAMTALLATRHRWGWRYAALVALVLGAVGATANVRVIWEVLG